MRKLIAIVFVASLAVGSAPAQKVEVAVVGGGLFSSSGTNFSSVDRTAAVEGSLAVRAFGTPVASLYYELPIAGGLQTSAHPASCATASCVAAQFSSLFVAPGLKLKIGAPLVPVSAFASAGVGLAHFTPS